MGGNKVLVVGINPWIDNTGINTLINFFSEWGTDKLAHIYTKDGLPNTEICSTFFQISERRVMKSVFSRSTVTGRRVNNTDSSAECGGSVSNAGKHSEWLSLAREFVWLFGRWKTAALNEFLDEFDPDVLFFPVYSVVYMNRLQRYIAKYSKKPVVLYSSDDNYSYLSVDRNPLSLIHRFWLRRHEKKLFGLADKVLVISPKQKEEYDRIFGIDCGILTKGIDYSNAAFREVKPHDPIRMVYTGKLIIGRGETLAMIADVMGEVNANGEKIALDIFTTDKMSEKEREKLNRNGCRVKGAVSLEEAQRIQNEADVLVFVEGLSKRTRYKARLSFSTKITDYLRAGKCILAVGDRNIAPIDYFLRNGSAVVASSKDEISGCLHMLADSPKEIAQYGLKAFACGKENHDRNKQREILQQSIRGVAYDKGFDCNTGL